MRSKNPNRQRALPIGLALVVVAALIWLAQPFSGLASPDPGTPLAPALSPALEPVRRAARAEELLTRDSELDEGAPSGEARLGRVDLNDARAVREAPRDGPQIRLSGRVVERDGGQPVERAQVKLDGGSWAASVLTDSDGRFQVESPADELPGLQVKKEGFALLARPVIDPQQEFLLELEREGRLVGRVVGPSPDALMDATAHLFWLTSGERLRRTESMVPLDSEGAFEFSQLASGEYELCADVPGWGLVFEHALEVRSGETTELELRPSRGALLRGRLTYVGSERPVVGALLRASPRVPGLPPEVEGCGERETTSDAEGRYELRGLAVGEVAVQVETDSGARARAERAVFEEAEVLEQDFQLQAPGSLAGRVISEAGQGVGFATLQVAWDAEPFSTRLDRPARERPGFLRVQCDVNGRFRLAGLPGGRSLRVVAFRAEEDGRAALAAEKLSLVKVVRLYSGEEREDFELRVSDTRSLGGVVVDQRGAPVPDAYLRLSRFANGENREDLRLQRLVTDESGEFELVGLLTGSYFIECQHPDYLQTRSKFRVDEDEIRPERLELELSPSQRITGWVVDERGDAVQRARVSAQAVLFDDRSPVGRTERNTRTDAFGRFVLTSVKPGTWSISASATGFERLPVPVVVQSRADAPQVLALRRDDAFQRSTLSGRVMGKDGSTPRELELDELRGGALEVARGAFRLTGARAGTARFRISAPGYLALRTPRLVLPPGGELDLGWLELEPAGDLRLHVRTPKGQPLRSFTATLEPLTGSKKARKKGALKLDLVKSRHRYAGSEERVATRAGVHQKVPLRRWRLRVEAGGFRPHEEELVFSKGRPELRLEVELKRR